MKSDPSKPLPTPEHEAFAVHFAMHNNAAKAWMHATGGDKAYADGNGSKWKGRGSIPARVAFLRQKAVEVANKAVAKDMKSAALSDEKKNVEAVMDAAERLLTLSGIARGSERDADRISAIKVLNDMTGEGSEAEANKATAASLAAQIAGIRTKRKA